MKILLATSEAVPFAKTGGLADVCGALPLELERLGHQVAVVLPAYRQAMWCGVPTQPTGIKFIVPIGSKTVTGHILESRLPGSDVPVYLIQQDEYYDREQIYQDSGKDYVDNCERFVFFSRAVMELIRLLELDIDCIHANDWQTGLVPAYLKIEYAKHPRYRNITSLFTIHNLAYQGTFWHWDMLLTGLDWKHFNWREMEFYGQLNLMKTGLIFADRLNTVSPRYAEEIQTPEFGCALESVLQYRRDDLSGILNGINGTEWDPATDALLAANYTAETVAQGKSACKAALQRAMGLPERPEVPVLGIVGRLAHQKGLDLITELIPDWAANHDAQWAVLGTGDQQYERLFREYTERYPAKVAARLEFSNELAHMIEAGADMFLMPSRYEPCGLNQMYSHKYGTVPIVRQTGGLADTIVDADEASIAAAAANGFSFVEDSAIALDATLRRACDAFADKQTWGKIVDAGMRQDWSWARSAEQYVALYEKMVERKSC